MTKTQDPNKSILWFTEIPLEVRDSFITMGGRKIAIIGFGIKRADQFQAHPYNWRKHPKRQQSAVEGSLNTLGWVDSVLENKTTGNLIDGHERVWNALKHDNAYVPFMQVELTPEEEAQALLSLDAIAALAETDRENVEELLRHIQTDDEDVMKFLDEFSQDIGLFNLPSLDELQDQYGEPGPEDFWPIISVKVSPETELKYKNLLAQFSGKTEGERFDALISCCQLP